MLYSQSHRYANVNTPNGAASPRHLATAAVFVTVFAGAGLLAADTGAATYYVSSSGSDVNSCTDGQQAPVAGAQSCLSSGDAAVIYGRTITSRNVPGLKNAYGNDVTIRDWSGVRDGDGAIGVVQQDGTSMPRPAGRGHDTGGFERVANGDILQKATPTTTTTVELPVLGLGWDPAADSSVRGYIVYVGVQSGVYTETYDVGNALTFWYPSAVSGQRYYFAVAAYDGGAVVGPRSLEVSGAIDDAPAPTQEPPPTQTAPVVVIVSPINGASWQGSGFFYGSAADTEDGTISSRMTWTSSIDGALGTGASFNKTLSAGMHVITASVTDSGGLVASTQVAVTIASDSKATPTPPTVSIISPINDASWQGSGFFYGSATDTEDGTISSRLTWTSSIDGALGTGASFNKVLSAGRHTITASVTDSGGLATSKQISVTIPAANTAPTVAIISPINDASWQGSGFFYGSATDTEDGTISSRLTWTSSIDGALGTGASFNKVLSAGRHTITASVTDSGGLATSKQISVTIPAANTAPTVAIISPINDASWQGSGFFYGSATDTEDGTISSRLTWTSSIDGALGTGASFNKVLSAGRHTITASVTDSGGRATSKQISVTIPAANTAPTVAIISPINDASWQGSGFFYGSATDTEDGTISSRLTWTSSIDGALGTGASFNKVLSAGRHTITASVTDSGGRATSKQISVTIPAANTAPTVAIISPINDASWQGSGFFYGSATDTEDGTISSRLTWTSSIDGALGTGASFNKVLSAGTHIITVSVTDSGGRATSKQISVTIPAANTAPSVQISSPISTSYAGGTNVMFLGAANDREDGNLTAQMVWTSSLSGQIGEGGSFSTSLTQGTHLITARVTDSAGATSTTQVIIAVATPVKVRTSKPTLAGSPYKIRQMQRVDLTWSGFPTSSVDIYRNGSRLGTSPNDGIWTDVLNNRGGGSYTYKVCGTGTTICSADVLVTF